VAFFLGQNVRVSVDCSNIYVIVCIDNWELWHPDCPSTGNNYRHSS